MASICIVAVGFLALLAGLAYFYDKTKRIAASAIIVVIGVVGLYICITLADLFLGWAGFETGFPYPEKGYYLYQAFIYIFMGVVALGTYYFLLKDSQAKEVSYAFLWTGTVLLLGGGSDLLLDTFIRIQTTEFRLCLALGVLITLIFIATKYRDRIFGRKEAAAQAPQQPQPKARPEAPKAAVPETPKAAVEPPRVPRGGRA